MWGLEREKLVADEAALKARIQQLEEDMAAQVANPPPHPDAAAPRSAGRPGVGGGPCGGARPRAPGTLASRGAGEASSLESESPRLTSSWSY